MKLFSGLFNNNQIKDNLRGDNINQSQYKTNLLYLMQVKENILYPREILKEIADYVAMDDYDYLHDKENIISYYDMFSESQKNLLKQVTPIVIKIAYNLYIPSFGGKWFIPQLLQDNPSKYYWYISAYPDVFDYFYTTMDCIKAREQDYRDHFDKITISRGKDSDACMSIFKEKYGKGDFLINKMRENSTQNMLIINKNYYKNVLRKKLLLAI